MVGERAGFPLHRRMGRGGGVGERGSWPTPLLRTLRPPWPGAALVAEEQIARHRRWGLEGFEFDKQRTSHWSQRIAFEVSEAR